jgi:hypothetical protein
LLNQHFGEMHLMSQANENQAPFSKSFAGHETFAFRYPWLKKGVDNLEKYPDLFQRDDAIVILGVGKNMIKSIRHWCLATRVIDEAQSPQGKILHPSKLGKKLLEDWDPYFEDDATLWLLHWNLASAGTRSATWYWAFNKFHEYAFTRQAITESLTHYIHNHGWTDVSESTIKRDVDCLVHTYLSKQDGNIGDDPIECPLTSLDLLIQEPDGDRLRFRVGPKNSLSIGIFAYALAEFWNKLCPERLTLELRQLTGLEGSPAYIFKLDEESIFNYLDGLKDATNGAMIFEDTSQVRRVVKQNESPLNSMKILEAYYGKR